MRTGPVCEPDHGLGCMGALPQDRHFFTPTAIDVPLWAPVGHPLTLLTRR